MNEKNPRRFSDIKCGCSSVAECDLDSAESITGDAETVGRYKIRKINSERKQTNLNCIAGYFMNLKVKRAILQYWIASISIRSETYETLNFQS